MNLKTLNSALYNLLIKGNNKKKNLKNLKILKKMKFQLFIFNK